MIPSFSRADIEHICSLYGYNSDAIESVNSFPSWEDQVLHIKIKQSYKSKYKDCIIKCSKIITAKRLRIYAQFMQHLNKHNVISI